MPGLAPTPPDEAFMDALRERMDPGKNCLGFADFMDCALYHPLFGYYQRDRQRVGHRREADFYTASSLGQVFTKLVMAAFQSLVEQPLEEFTFIEIGPESSGGLLSGIGSHPFRDQLQVHYGEPFPVSTPCIVFSNELFDAQPFRRFVWKDASWQELGVRVAADQLVWCLLPDPVIPAELPEEAPEGYLVDWPSAARSLLVDIASEDWSGLFVAFDYGLPINTVLHQRPQGTARTYSGHRMGTDLLDQPGHIDLTCHVIWDILESVLLENSFSPVNLEFQEAFFMHHSQPALKDIIERPGPGFSKEKQTLMELIHPGNMGQKFQVLHAKRGIG